MVRFHECGRVFVYRRNGIRFDKENVQVVDRSGRATVPVWGCFAASGDGPLVRIEGRFNKEKYIDILENQLLPFVRENFGDRHVRFIQDRSPIHTAIVVRR